MAGNTAAWQDRPYPSFRHTSGAGHRRRAGAAARRGSSSGTALPCRCIMILRRLGQRLPSQHRHLELRVWGAPAPGDKRLQRQGGLPYAEGTGKQGAQGTWQDGSSGDQWSVARGEAATHRGKRGSSYRSGTRETVFRDDVPVFIGQLHGWVAVNVAQTYSDRETTKTYEAFRTTAAPIQTCTPTCGGARHVRRCTRAEQAS